LNVSFNAKADMRALVPAQVAALGKSQHGEREGERIVVLGLDARLPQQIGYLRFGWICAEAGGAPAIEAVLPVVLTHVSLRFRERRQQPGLGKLGAGEVNSG
jgi:hypothetical protein